MAVSVYSAAVADRRIAEINITPLVDVMLVLLVIFMISAPTVAGTLAMDLAHGDGRRSEPAPTLQLEVDASGHYRRDGAEVSRAALARALREVAQRAPGTTVRIEASSEADYQAFATALSTARASGLVNVTLQR